MSIHIETKKDMTVQNTFKMKVSCACFIEYESLEDLEHIDINRYPQPFKSIGQGSNLLFKKNYRGTLLHSKIQMIETVRQSDQEVILKVGAGVIFDDLCQWIADHGWWGTENLSSIPGQVGAAAVQNIGAYGVEFKDVVDEVICYHLQDRQVRIFQNTDCNYGYRTSIFKAMQDPYLVVTHVLLRLKTKNAPVLTYGHLEQYLIDHFSYEGKTEELTPSIIRQAVMQIRAEKLPDLRQYGSAGSFFKNPMMTKEKFDKIQAIFQHEEGPSCQVPHYLVRTEQGEDQIKVPAAWLIERCGWKGYLEGNVGVYSKQPLVLVNLTGMATPEEMVALKDKIVDSVFTQYGILLNPEVEII